MTRLSLTAILKNLTLYLRLEKHSGFHGKSSIVFLVPFKFLRKFCSFEGFCRLLKKQTQIRKSKGLSDFLTSFCLLTVFVLTSYYLCVALFYAFSSI